MPYGQFIDEDGSKCGSYEVFYNDGSLLSDGCSDECCGGWPEGWYWWARFPGCLPDGGALGPFDTEGEAENDALEGF